MLLILDKSNKSLKHFDKHFQLTSQTKCLDEPSDFSVFHDTLKCCKLAVCFPEVRKIAIYVMSQQQLTFRRRFATSLKCISITCFGDKLFCLFSFSTTNDYFFETRTENGQRLPYHYQSLSIKKATRVRINEKDLFVLENTQVAK